MFQRIKAFFKRAMNLGQLREFVYGPPTMAGVAVSEEIALGISAFKRAVELKSATLAGLSVEVYRDDGRGHRGLPRHWVSMLLRDPNDDQNAYKFFYALYLQVCCSGNGYAEIERDELDRPVGLHLLHWRNVRVMRLPGGELVYRLVKEGEDLPAADVVHVTELSWDGLMGISPVTAGRETLGLSVAADRHAASTFGNGAVPKGFLRVPSAPNVDTKLAIREAWEAIYGGPSNSEKIGILFGGTEWVETNMSPADSQLLQSRAFQISEVSRITGVPPNLLFSGEQSSYNADEESNLAFFELGLSSFIDRAQAEFSFKLLTPAERFVGYAIRYKVEHKFPRATAAKSGTWSNLVLKGIATQNEARIALGLNPMDGADVLLVPTNLAVATDGDGTVTTGTLKALNAPAPDPGPAPDPDPGRGRSRRGDFKEEDHPRGDDGKFGSGGGGADQGGADQGGAGKGPGTGGAAGGANGKSAANRAAPNKIRSEAHGELLKTQRADRAEAGRDLKAERKELREEQREAGRDLKAEQRGELKEVAQTHKAETKDLAGAQRAEARQWARDQKLDLKDYEADDPEPDDLARFKQDQATDAAEFAASQARDRDELAAQQARELDDVHAAHAAAREDLTAEQKDARAEARDEARARVAELVAAQRQEQADLLNDERSGS